MFHIQTSLSSCNGTCGTGLCQLHRTDELASATSAIRLSIIRLSQFRPHPQDLQPVQPQTLATKLGRLKRRTHAKTQRSWRKYLCDFAPLHICPLVDFQAEQISTRRLLPNSSVTHSNGVGHELNVTTYAYINWNYDVISKQWEEKRGILQFTVEPRNSCTGA
jgi:hypothetical protein